MKKYVLAIDLGSTNFKAAVFDEALNTKGFAKNALTYSHPGVDSCELSISCVSDALSECIKNSLSSANISGKELRAIAITGQAQTFTLDSEEQNFISWLDKRADITNLNNSHFASDFARHSCSGKISSSLQLSMVYHFFRNSKQHLLPLHSYLTKRLCGQVFSDDNMAAMTGFYSLIEKRWWQPALDLCGLKTEQMPCLCGTGTVAALTTLAAQDFGLAAGIPIILCGNDQTTGALGVDLKPDEVFLSLGTAFVAYAIFDKLPEHRTDTLRGVYPNSRFYRLAIAGTGGRDLQAAANKFAGGDFHKLFSERASNKFAVKKLLEDLSYAINQCAGNQISKLIVSGGGNIPELIKLLHEYTGVETVSVNTSPLAGAAKTACKLSH